MNMCYTITLLSLVYGTSLFLPSLRNTHDTVKGHGFGWRPGYVLPDVPHPSVLAAEQVQTTAPDKKQSTPEKEDTTKERGQQDGEPPQQRDKKPPLKEFVPSEKINADKAVDFPADI